MMTYRLCFIFLTAFFIHKSSVAGHVHHGPLFLGSDLSISGSLFADSLKVKKPWSRAKKAAVFSACLPGLGQAYNKKYLKIPVIYLVMGGLGYSIYANNAAYQDYHNELIFRGNNAGLVNDFPQYSTDNLVTQKRIFRRYRDLSIMGAALVYVLQIIDANVDGHLHNFDVDNISFNVSPFVQPSKGIGSRGFGLNISATF
jgi:hypothetical protein